MLYGELQFFDILIFAVIAGFLIYRLRSVLGKRTGFEKKAVDTNEPQKKNLEEEKNVPSLSENEIKFAFWHDYRRKRDAFNEGNV